MDCGNKSSFAMKREKLWAISYRRLCTGSSWSPGRKLTFPMRNWNAGDRNRADGLWWKSSKAWASHELYRYLQAFRGTRTGRYLDECPKHASGYRSCTPNRFSVENQAT